MVRRNGNDNKRFRCSCASRRGSIAGNPGFYKRRCDHCGTHMGWAGFLCRIQAAGFSWIIQWRKLLPSAIFVAVSGVSFPGGYAPCITKPHWEKLGTAPLPAAKPVTIEQLMSGAEDSQRVEISGIVRAAWTNSNRLGIELVSGGFRLRAFSPIPPDAHPESLVGAKALLKGTAATAFNAPLRHFITVTFSCRSSPTLSSSNRRLRIRSINP